MSGGEGRKLTNQDIQLVQNRVEQCLQHYMDKKEVINTLIIHDNIEPRVTELVIEVTDAWIWPLRRCWEIEPYIRKFGESVFWQRIIKFCHGSEHGFIQRDSSDI